MNELRMAQLKAAGVLKEQQQSPETKEKQTFSQVEMGYIRPLPDLDEVGTYWILKNAGVIEDDAEITFNHGRSTDQSLFESPHIAKIEAAYNAPKPEDENYDPRLADPKLGNFSHRHTAEGGEMSATKSAFEHYREEIAETHPDKLAQIEAVVEYIDQVDLGKKRGGKRPALAHILNGARLSHFGHPALGNEATDLSAGVEASVDVLQKIIDSDQDPFDAIDITVDESFAHYEGISQRQYEHDRPIMAKQRPQVVETARGVYLGHLDVREETIGESMILPQGGFSQLTRYADPANKLKSDIGFLVSDIRDKEGVIVGTKMQVAMNVRNKHVLRKIDQLGLDLGELTTRWNNLEYVQGELDADELQVGLNAVGGHLVELPTPDEDAEPMVVMTITNSPAETGSGLEPEIVRAMIEEYFNYERFTDAELNEIGHQLGLEDFDVVSVSAEYPHNQLDEKAISTCKLNPGKPRPGFHTCTAECRVTVARESELVVTRDEEGAIQEVRALYPEEKAAQSQELFEKHAAQSPRKALHELAKGRVSIEDYNDPEFLLQFFERISQDHESIRQIYDPSDETLDPPHDTMVVWGPTQRKAVETTKYGHERSVPYMIDTQLQVKILNNLAEGSSLNSHERYIAALENIVTSTQYLSSHEESKIYDHLAHHLLSLALNTDVTKELTTTAQTLQTPPEVRERARKVLAQLPANVQRHLGAHVSTSPTMVVRGNSIKEQAFQMLPLAEREAIPASNLAKIEKDRLLPNEYHLAVLLGRQNDIDGTDLLEKIEKPDQVGQVDKALRAEILPNSEFLTTAVDIIEELEASIADLIERLPEDEQAEVAITYGGPQVINSIVWEHVGRLKEEHKGKLSFTFYQSIAGRYRSLLQSEDVQAELTRRLQARQKQ